jgi:hypothetical protein
MQKQNRGTGISSGVWLFEEFEFLPGVLGRANVYYNADAKRLAKQEVTDGLCGRPYEIELNLAKVERLAMFDDSGNEIELDLFELREAQEKILSAWREAADHVVDFEMGLL